MFQSLTSFTEWQDSRQTLRDLNSLCWQEQTFRSLSSAQYGEQVYQILVGCFGPGKKPDWQFDDQLTQEGKVSQAVRDMLQWIHLELLALSKFPEAPFGQQWLQSHPEGMFAAAWTARMYCLDLSRQGRKVTDITATSLSHRAHHRPQ